MQSTISPPNALEVSPDVAPQIDVPAKKSLSASVNKKARFASLALTLGLSALSAGLVLTANSLGWFVPMMATFFFLPLPDARKLDGLPLLLPALLIFAASFAVGVLTHYHGARKICLFVIGAIVLLIIAGAVSARFVNLDIAALAISATTIFSLVAVQQRRLWQVDEQLTTSIRRLALTNHALEGKRADLRMTSGLQLLQSVLPLDEIVVFELMPNGELAPIGRSRDDKNDINKKNAKNNQSNWREGIELCEEALNSGAVALRKTEVDASPLIHTTHAPMTTTAARVAVPLVHEDKTLGVLLVHFRENFEDGDLNLLSAFAEQLARNFQRQETRKQFWAHPLFDFLSAKSSNQRLDGFRLVSGLLSEQQFGSLAFSQLNDAYAVAYLDGTLAYINRPMLKAAQINSDRAKQTDLFALLDRFRGGVFDDPRIAIRRVLQSGDKYQHEIQFPERGQIFELQISLVREEADVQAVHDASEISKPLCLMVSARDITAQKANEKLRSDMVSLMSHELRTPITSINGFAELLMIDDNIPAESREFLKIISNESQRISRMLNTFLAVSKLEQSDKREVLKVPIRLDALAHEVIEDIQPLAKSKRIRLIEQSNAHLPPVAGDKGLITKVITHLVDNAIKYSPERTTIAVLTVLETDSVRVVVEDRGYGIPAESMEKIWEKFYRVPRDEQDKNETSTGLGLAFVKEVVEQHGGTVFVESEINQGSRFSFTLPRL
ncbi:MAG: GAF domain-containing sensor histidine kinase [Pyrinomonadaceae bacterium]|nr:GAF domain-containing sensor histidine kinase [Pyrinomonadaceae bacterium]